jgi:hypothetical protein
MIRNINIGDVIATKDGRTFEVLSIYAPDGDIKKLEGIDRNSGSPMRTTILKDNFRAVVKKAKKVYDSDEKKWAELQTDGSYKLVEPAPIGGN